MHSKAKTIEPMDIGGRRFEWDRRTYVMGVLNVTPDSFSGDGLGSDVQDAVDRGLRFEEWGADILDVGGESTRPPSVYAGARPTSADDELRRVLPVLERLSGRVSVPLSIDTYKARVASEALAAGASMINDVWGLRRDPEMAGLAADRGVPVVLMHNQERGGYGDVVADVIKSLSDAIEKAVYAGVSRDKIIVDPGFGFGGKSPAHNLEIIRRLREFESLERPLLMGTSRKSTIGRVLDLPVEERLEGTAATVVLSIVGGADIVRVHDVKEMARISRMTDALVRGWDGP